MTTGDNVAIEAWPRKSRDGRTILGCCSRILEATVWNPVGRNIFERMLHQRLCPNHQAEIRRWLGCLRNISWLDQPIPSRGMTNIAADPVNRVVAGKAVRPLVNWDHCNLLLFYLNPMKITKWSRTVYERNADLWCGSEVWYLEGYLFSTYLITIELNSVEYSTVRIIAGQKKCIYMLQSIFGIRLNLPVNP